jgi:DNA gyrase subunit B
MAAEYSAKSIKVLEGLDAVRLRPAMYIGSTSKDGLHHCVYEVLDNGVDEVQAGTANLIEISINKDGSLTVIDNGRGIPVGKHASGKSALEVVMTKLHAGGKFENKAYQISGGLHGVGVSCVNALSDKLIARVKRDGKIYEQVYNRGVPKSAVKVVGKTKNKEDTGTEIIFWPDKEIFSTTEFDYNVIAVRVRELAFLNPNAKIIVKNEKTGKQETFHYEGGLTEFVKHINRTKTALHKPIYFQKKTDSTVVEVAIQYFDGFKENIFGFVNTINTVEGGTHISGFKTALTRAINDYVTKKSILKNGKLSGDDVREGLTAIVNVRLKNPQFEGQTKTKLGNSEVKGYVDSIVSSALTEYLEENPGVANKVANKAVAAAKARDAAKRARDLVRRKTIGSLSGLPGKLADCSSKKVERTELYIVEGDSAAGSSKMARDKEFQAILPLKGKILNVEKATPVKALSSEQIINLITAMGTNVKENFDITKLRYSKVIIMTDADVDGQHISTLLLTFFYRYVPELIENGNIYVAMSPLYRVRSKGKDVYVYSDEELKKTVDKISGKSEVQRFKGLGEMNANQLWDTTMNPKKRILKKVTIEDAIRADEIFSMLMGDVVGPRRKFIETNANIAEVDI